ncbi:unnamed protein product [Scytosiphon promiscuus]
MAASELSELRAELWRTRDDLERMKARGTPPSAGRSPRLLFDRRHHDPPATAGSDLGGSGRVCGRGAGGEGIRSGPTSPPTSGDSSRGIRAPSTRRSPRRKRSPGSRDRYPGSSEEIGAAAEETLCNLALEGAAFKNWTEEASSIAVRLIEEVKALRWEKAGWADRERAAENAAELAAAELRARADRLEERLRSAEADGRQGGGEGAAADGRGGGRWPRRRGVGGDAEAREGRGGCAAAAAGRGEGGGGEARAGEEGVEVVAGEAGGAAAVLGQAAEEDREEDAPHGQRKCLSPGKGRGGRASERSRRRRCPPPP